MYATQVPSRLAMERQRVLSDEAAEACALRRAAGVRQPHSPADPRLGVIARVVSLLRLRAGQPEFIDAEASVMCEAVPRPARVR